MIGAAGDRIRQFRPRSRLVQIAQIELLLHHTRCQTLAAPFLGVFLVLAFASAGKPAWAWGWIGCLVLAYGARIVASLRLRPGCASAYPALSVCQMRWGVAGMPISLPPLPSIASMIAL